MIRGENPLTLCRALGASAGELAQLMGEEVKGWSAIDLVQMKSSHAGRVQPEHKQEEQEEQGKVRDACPSLRACFTRVACATLRAGMGRRVLALHHRGTRLHVYAVVMPAGGRRRRSMHSVRLLISAHLQPWLHRRHLTSAQAKSLTGWRCVLSCSTHNSWSRNHRNSLRGSARLCVLRRL